LGRDSARLVAGLLADAKIESSRLIPVDGVGEGPERKEDDDDTERAWWSEVVDSEPLMEAKRDSTVIFVLFEDASAADGRGDGDDIFEKSLSSSEPWWVG
jgi:hypothetical protein